MKQTAEVLQTINDFCLEEAKINRRLIGQMGPFMKYHEGQFNAYSNVIKKIDELANKLDK